MHPLFDITCYLLISFSWTYLFWGTISLCNRGILKQNPPSSFLHFGGFGPLVSSCCLTLYFNGWEAFKLFWSNMYNFNFELEWYLFAFFVPFVISIFGFILSIFPVKLFNSPVYSIEKNNLFIFVFGFIFSCIAIIGEEAGWRGYLLPRLTIIISNYFPVYYNIISSVIIGCIWSIWHLPIFYWDDYPLVVDGYKLKDIVKYQICYAIGLSSISIIMTWIYINTSQSIIGMLIVHSSLNATVGLCGVKRLNNIFFYIGISTIPIIYNLIQTNQI